MFNKLLDRFKTSNDLNLEEFRLDFRTFVSFEFFYPVKLKYINTSSQNNSLKLINFYTTDISNSVKIHIDNKIKSTNSIKLAYFIQKLDEEIKLHSNSKFNYNLNLHSVSGFSLSSIMKLNLSYSTMMNLRITFMRGIFICNSKREMIFRITLIKEQKTFEFQIEESILNDLLIRFNIFDSLQSNPNVSLSYNSYWKLLTELKDACQEYSIKNNMYWAKCEELGYLINHEKSKVKEQATKLQLKNAITDEKVEDIYSWDNILIDEKLLKLKELKEAYLNDISIYNNY